jgi:hypothetical protein
LALVSVSTNSRSLGLHGNITSEALHPANFYRLPSQLPVLAAHEPFLPLRRLLVTASRLPPAYSRCSLSSPSNHLRFAQ